MCVCVFLFGVFRLSFQQRVEIKKLKKMSDRGEGEGLPRRRMWGWIGEVVIKGSRLVPIRTSKRTEAEECFFLLFFYLKKRINT